RRDVRPIREKDTGIAMIGERRAATRYFSRPLFPPAESVGRNNHDGGIARQHIHPFANQPINFRVVVRHGWPEAAVSLLTDSFAVWRMKGGEEVIHRVRSFEGNHDQ